MRESFSFHIYFLKQFVKCSPNLSNYASYLKSTPYSSEEKDLGKLSDEEDGSETTAGPATDELPSEPATPTPVPDGEKVEGEEPIDPSRPQWPSMQDLNSRLRKVITSYQRNFKKEELKLAQKAKVSS